MKTRFINLLNVSSLLLTAGLWLTSCETSDGDGDDVIGDVVVNSDGSELYSQLSHYSSRGYPTDTDTWVIEDATASTNDFIGLSTAIVTLAESGREISLEFPNMTSIPDYAIFGVVNAEGDYALEALVSVSAAKATSVGDYAFKSCPTLASIDLPSATSIGFASFGDCPVLETVNIPMLTSLGSMAFYYCTALTEIELTKVTEVGSLAFGFCAALKEIELPAATTIGSDAFALCSALTSADMPVATLIEEKAFSGCTSLTTVNAPKVTEVETEAFLNCESITSLDLPSVTKIGYAAFYNCSSLAAISLATNSDVVLTSVDADTFNTDDISLTIGSANSDYVVGNALVVGGTYINMTAKEITVVDGDGAEVSGSVSDPFSILAHYSANSYPTDNDDWVITDSEATTAGFNGLRSAIAALAESGRSISLEFENMTVIPDYAIYGDSITSASCSYAALTSIISDNTTTIGASAFEACTGLSSIEMPNVNIIGSYAFGSCSSLTGIEFDYAHTIGEGAFSDCSLLVDVDLHLITVLADNLFKNCTSLLGIDFHHVIAVGDYTFYGCSSLTSVALEVSSYVTVGSYAFCSCSNLSTVEIPTLHTVGDYAFFGCSSLEELNFPFLTTIGAGFIANCYSLTTLTICSDESMILESVDADAFDRANNTEITLYLGKTLNTDYVSGSSLIFGDCNTIFYLIYLIDDDSDLTDYECDCGDEDH